jgi:hypothetical protein
MNTLLSAVGPNRYHDAILHSTVQTLLDHQTQTPQIVLVLFGETAFARAINLLGQCFNNTGVALKPVMLTMNTISRSTSQFGSNALVNSLPTPFDEPDLWVNPNVFLSPGVNPNVLRFGFRRCFADLSLLTPTSPASDAFPQ